MVAQGNEGMDRTVIIGAQECTGHRGRHHLWKMKEYGGRAWEGASSCGLWGCAAEPVMMSCVRPGCWVVEKGLIGGAGQGRAGWVSLDLGRVIRDRWGSFLIIQN